MKEINSNYSVDVSRVPKTKRRLRTSSKIAIGMSTFLLAACGGASSGAPVNVASVPQFTPVPIDSPTPAIDFSMNFPTVVMIPVDNELLENADLVGDLKNTTIKATAEAINWTEIVSNDFSQVAVNSFAEVVFPDIRSQSGAMLHSDGFWFYLASAHMVKEVNSFGNIMVARMFTLPNSGLVDFNLNEYGISYIFEDQSGDSRRDFGVIAFPDNVATSKFAGMFNPDTVLQIGDIYSGKVPVNAKFHSVCKNQNIYRVEAVKAASINPLELYPFGRQILLDNARVDMGCSGGELLTYINGKYFYVGNMTNIFGSDGSELGTRLADNVLMNTVESLNDMGGIQYFLDEAVRNYQSKQ